MANLLGEVDTNTTSRRAIPRANTIKSESRRKVRVLSPPIESRTKPIKRDPVAPHTPPDENNFFDDQDDATYLPNNDEVEISLDNPIPSSPMVKALQRKNDHIKHEDDDEEDAMEVSQAVADHTIKDVKVNITGSKPTPRKLQDKNSYPTPASSSPTRAAAANLDPSTWNDVTAKLNVLSSPAETTSYGKIKVEDATEEDGTIRLFWTDYTEVNNSVCLFGKVRDKRSGRYVSACVKVENILRKLYFLPREHRRSKFLSQSPNRS